jgi:hypothetical protein
MTSDGLACDAPLNVNEAGAADYGPPKADSQQRTLS